MPRFGYNRRIIFLGLFVASVNAACADIHSAECHTYDDKDMGRLAIFVRVTMDIVSSSDIDYAEPIMVAEEKLRELIHARGTPFSELALLDQYEVTMFFQNGEWATVAWDPASDQKLLQDMRCTKFLDDQSWKSCAHGHELTLDWRACK